MPLYLFANPYNEEDVEEVFFKMNDEKRYFKNGVEWNRVFISPHASIDAVKIDPFSLADYKKSTNNKKLTVGDLLDKSKELSSLRAEKNGGADPVKEKYYEEYKKKTGKRHPEKKREEAIKKCDKLGFEVNL